MTVFDATSRETCLARRNHTDTPLQALTTLNDPAFFEAAQSHGETNLERRRQHHKIATRLWLRLLATSRHPKPSESDTLQSAYETERNYFQSKPKEAEAIGHATSVALLAELAAWTMLSRDLLNLDETMTRH